MDGAAYPVPTRLVKISFGPVIGKELIKPVSFDMLSPVGPKNLGQSSAELEKISKKRIGLF